MNWNRSYGGVYECSVFKDGEVTCFQVTSDGHYKVFRPNSAKGLDILASGFVAGGTAEAAARYLDGIYDAKPEPVAVQEVVVPAKEEVAEATPAEEVTAVVTEEAPQEAPQEVAPAKPSVVIEVVTEEDGENVKVALFCAVEGVVLKYATGGKQVVASSRIYREPLVVPAGSSLNVVAFLDKEPVASLSDVQV